MGDRFELVKDCVYCGTKKDDIWYAPTSGFYTFECVKCKKENFITQDFNVKKLEDVTLDDVRDAFLMSSNVSWSDEDLDRMCKDTLKQIKGGKHG